MTLIKTPVEHAAALAEVEALIAADPSPDTPDGDRLELLALLIEHYERKHFSCPATSPQEAIRFRMEQQGLRDVDVALIMNVRSNRFYEVMSGTRELSKAMIVNLHWGLGIPADVLLGIHRP